jgi:hypothetical protein
MTMVLALAAAGSGPVDACDSTSCSLLTRNDNGLVPRGKFRFSVSYGYTDMGVKLKGAESVDQVLRPRVFLERGWVVPDFHEDARGYDSQLQIDLIYGLSSRVNLAASVPFPTWHSHTVSHGGPPQEYGTVGFGDTLVGARWSMNPRNLVGGLSVKVPTGRDDIGGEFGGGIQDPALQPGTGAFDVVGFLQYTWSADSLKLHWSAAANYQLTTTNDFEYRFGNQTILTLAVSRPLTSRLSASLQGKLFHQDRSRFVGEDVPSTGATFAYANVGIQCRAGRGLSLYTFLQLVPYRYVNEAQLGPRAAVLAGFSKLF